MYSGIASPLPSPCQVQVPDFGARDLLHKPLCVISLVPEVSAVLATGVKQLEKENERGNLSFKG